jgi:MFS family permease
MAFDKRIKQNLRTLTLAAGVSRFGDHFQTLAVTSVTYAITGSPLAAGAQMAMTSLPYVFFARWTGRAADRFDTRKLFGLLNFLRFLLTLAYISVPNPALILALNFVGSTMGAFMAPARARLLPDLVGRDNLLKANARQSTVIGAVELLGPVVAGLFLKWSGPGWAFFLNAISYLAPAAAMLLVHPVEHTAPAPRGAEPTRTWTFLRARPSLLMLLAANAVFQFGMWAINAIFYPFVADVLHRGPDVLGWTISAYFGAGLISGAVMERWGERLRRNDILFAGFACATLVWFGYTFAYNVPLILLLSIFDGIIFTMATILFTTRVQEEAPREAVGRVFAVATASQEATSSAGMLMGGWLATAAGILPGMRVSAGLCLLFLLPLPLVGRTRLRLRHAKEAS